MNMSESNIYNHRNEPTVIERMKLTVIEYRELVNKLKSTPRDSEEFEKLEKECGVVRARFDKLSMI